MNHAKQAAATAQFICLGCGLAFLADYGCGGGSYCSEECERPPIELPADDDGYDGLDCEAGDTHCVFAQLGCDPSDLPDEWREEGAAAAREIESRRPGRPPARWCVCGTTHTVLARSEVRRLRIAGYLVEVCHDRGDDRDGWRDLDDDCQGDVFDLRSSEAYLLGHFDDDDFDPSLQAMEYEWLSSILVEEEEVLEQLGFSKPSGFREFLFELAASAPPEKHGRRSHDVVRVGAFVVKSERGHVVVHGHGGMVPRADGSFAGEARFGSLQEAVTHAEACWSALLLGVSTPFRVGPAANDTEPARHV